ncbi:hypothetical protein JRQ81_013645, partial [Phrynocephalus forsythii]
MEAYTQYVLQKFLPIFDLVPDDQKNKALTYHAEDMSVIDYEMIAARHGADAATKHIATAIYLRRHTRLRTA